MYLTKGYITKEFETKEEIFNYIKWGAQFYDYT